MEVEVQAGIARQDAQRSSTKRLAHERGDVRSILHVKPILSKDDS